MAIYHASMKAVQRSTGRSSVAAAAYRAGDVLLDESTGRVHDYSKKRGVLHSEIITPGGQMIERGDLWSRVELHHKRKDATTARELETALPVELLLHEKKALALAMGQALADEYGVAVDVCLHAPSGDERNFHVHILMTSCSMDEDGSLGKKVERLDPIHCARKKIPTAAEWVRPLWEKLVNEALEKAGHAVRVDHRSHKARGLAEELPGSHMGPAVAGIVARGDDSHVARRMADAAALHALAVMARQVQDAQAQAEALEALAAQAAADLEAELEIERAQAAQEAAEAAARAQAAEIQRQRQAFQAAYTDQEQAQAAVDAAERTCFALRPACDSAISEQRQAGRSLLATVRALPKAAQWKRAIDAYNTALDALECAQKVLAQAGRALAAVLARLEMLDPAVRERREARERATRQAYQEQRRIAEATAAAAAQHARGRLRGLPVFVPVEVAHQDQDEDDQERPT